MTFLTEFAELSLHYLPDIKGTVVTADAMHTQRTESELIIDKGGDWVLTVKRNQRSLHKDAKAWLADPGNAEKML